MGSYKSDSVSNSDSKASYKGAGVDTRKVESALVPMFESIRSTWGGGKVKLDLGHFANIVDLGSVRVAISTDGVGTKSMVAQLMGMYVSIGIDCVAVNVNDVLCVGARPESLVDYLAVRYVENKMMSEIGEGLRIGAQIAGISVVGGETAQLPEMINSQDDQNGFDLAGTCIGTVGRDEMVTGSRMRSGDCVLGIRSDGVHCNGFTLVRKVFGITSDAGKESQTTILSTYSQELGRTLGQELLRPTRIYVNEIMALSDSEVDVRGLAHISGDGFLNLCRLQSDVGYVIDNLPRPHPIFGLIQKKSRLPDEEMFEIFNMGIGFCVIVPEKDVSTALQIISEGGAEAYRIGYLVDDSTRTVDIRHVGIRGRLGEGLQKICT